LVNSSLKKDLLELLDLKSVPNLIDGNFVYGDKSIPKFNPTNGEVHYEVSQISKKEYKEVIHLLKNNTHQIENTNFYERSEIILRASKLIEQNIEILSEISSSDSGKTINESMGRNSRIYKDCKLFWHRVDEKSG
jgi:acyl-CoA reductase-like NAD-dependent aldehyde dehydrogenase